MSRRATIARTALLLSLALPLRPAIAAVKSPALVRAPVVNPGFEAPAPGASRTPPGWFSIQHAGELSYRFVVDTTLPHAGAASLRIENIGPEPFGSTYQQVPAAAYRGQRLRFSGWLRTEDVSGSATGGGAVLMLQAMQNGAVLAWNHMDRAAITGTAPWRRYAIELDVPAAAEQVEIGVMLHGPGRLWFDDAELEVLPHV